MCPDLSMHAMFSMGRVLKAKVHFPSQIHPIFQLLHPYSNFSN